MFLAPESAQRLARASSASGIDEMKETGHQRTEALNGEGNTLCPERHKHDRVPRQEGTASEDQSASRKQPSDPQTPLSAAPTAPTAASPPLDQRPQKEGSLWAVGKAANDSGDKSGDRRASLRQGGLRRDDGCTPDWTVASRRMYLEALEPPCRSEGVVPPINASNSHRDQSHSNSPRIYPMTSKRPSLSHLHIVARHDLRPLTVAPNSPH